MWTSPVTYLLGMQETRQEPLVRSLGWEDSLEKEMATHSSILAWRILWTERPGGLQSIGSQSDTTERLNNGNNKGQQLYSKDGGKCALIY